MSLEKRLAQARALFNWASTYQVPIEDRLKVVNGQIGDLLIRARKATTSAELNDIQKDLDAIEPEKDELIAWKSLAKAALRDLPDIIKDLEDKLLNEGLSKQDRNQKQNFENLIEAPSQTAGPENPEEDAVEFNLSNNGSIH
jgi:hypothetical protein